MKAQKTSPMDIKRLAKRKAKSHKGENGIVLAIVGSKAYHGAAVFACITASRLVDLVFICTAKENVAAMKKASPGFIVASFSKIRLFLQKADSVLIGPGLEKTKKMQHLINSLVSKNKGKKFVLDATALRLLNPKNLHSNCVVTPHANEFRQLFKMRTMKENALKAAGKFHCLVVLKGPVDFISDGRKLIENKGGSPMLTTGGTGDILAGLIAGFAAKNSLLLSAKAACFLNKSAAKLLQKEKGSMWNAHDLMEKLPCAKKRLES